MPSILDTVVETRKISPQILTCLEAASLSLEELQTEQSPESFAEFVHMSTPEEMEKWAVSVLKCGEVFGIHSSFQKKLVYLAQLIYTEATGNPALTREQIRGLIFEELSIIIS